MYLTIIYIINVLLQLFDGYSTYRILKNGGREKNPIVKWMMDRVGMVGGLVIAKILALYVISGIYILGINIDVATISSTLLSIVAGLHIFLFWKVGHLKAFFRGIK
jgi:hypothetical protein